MKKLSLAAVVILTAVLSGCAAPSRVEQMVAQTAPADRILQTPMSNNVAVNSVSGGKDTNPLWVSNVGNSEFEQALEASLKEAGMLSASKKDGKYVLVATMEKLDQPMMGFNMTVTATVNYVLTERATGKEVMSKRIAVPFTAKVGDAFAGVERLRLANEGAVRSNIGELIGEIRKVGVSGVALN
ncbi:hypothetical protein [Massilia glaciei]|uniref:UDP-N-acetylglucosamine acyltransferase n=1 Tax=Massilia glaciei TaxID=1524097 RepID=A0A2U2I5T9_9BURK|nr:hypothetical protein [Massilia glaciei]PWF55128.1 hypothetical protein C7C56_003405 [Massilia glaciei]